jgi:phenylpropionate dioxygenase-like ring-hydroxylating dioxygenase large terminal subunit
MMIRFRSCYHQREREEPGMDTARKYAVIDPDTGKLDRRIFSDEAVYDDEMEKIFGRAWLMIGHESLVPNVDDFFHTYMGEDPVILTRDGEGRLHALLNMCRHRGNRVVRCDDGNAKRFMCTYHGWTYRNDGALEYVPGEAQAYYDALDRPSLGLIEACVETYAGIVFATWAKDAPSLEAYLGDARWYLDTVFNRRECGMQALGPMKWLEPVNWKPLVDNCSDNYHVPTSHLSSARVQTRHLGRPPLSHEDQFASPNRHAFVNGHSLTSATRTTMHPALRARHVERDDAALPGVPRGDNARGRAAARQRAAPLGRQKLEAGKPNRPLIEGDGCGDAGSLTAKLRLS